MRVGTLLTCRSRLRQRWLDLEGKSKWRRDLHTALTAPAFDAAIVCVVLGNTVALALDHEGASDEQRARLALANVCFAGAFTLELGAKLVGEQDGGELPWLWIAQMSCSPR